MTQARLKRINDAIELKEPDRVPIYFQSNYLPAKMAGLNSRDAYYKIDEHLESYRKFLLEYKPDIFFSADTPVITPGPIHDLWGTAQMLWPGEGISVHSSHQFVEGEYMNPEEYDHFLDDPSDFLVRIYTPRVFKRLEGLGLLPSLMLSVLGCYGGGFWAGMLAQPEVTKALELLLEASKVGAEWNMKYADFHQKMEEDGYVPSHTAPVLVPFDVISDLLRGMRGAMLDMYRIPDKLIAAQERLLPLLIATAIQGAKASGIPRVFMPLHRGADGFMSIEQFERFYWPFTKELILALIDEGLTPMPFFEGMYDQRLEHLAELPKGKVLGMFDRSDIFKVKEVLKDTMCITGGMPISLLQTGTPESVKEYTKKLIDVVGKDGGFIMGSSTVLDEAQPELVRVWADYTKEYGTYR